ncbi:hypothetical protein FSPOR_6097 [Fusarium sporotrichioides]|uniref:Uncharacterized protein n=1 Tax=Fusarium sporotrichioides TaxID=5514 RepID=A0A395S527_FUSSP|nr:hypothetical protein FSPOR_6097 [Fusarium sporotrichioides]
MYLLALSIVGLVIRGARGHAIEVLTTPCPPSSISQDGGSFDSPEATLLGSSIVVVDYPATVEPTILTTLLESEPVTEAPVESVAPCNTSQPSLPAVSYEPETESVYHIQSVLTTETTSSSQYVETMTAETQTPCTEATEDVPVPYSEPGTDIIQPTIQASEAPGPAPEPSKYDAPEAHSSYSIPLSEPAQPPISTEPVRAPIDEPTVISQQTQPPPSSFKTVTSLAAAPTNYVVELNLTDATLGLYATFIEIDGRRAIRLAPPPNGEASFNLTVNEELDCLPDSLFSFEASIIVGSICPNTKHKAKLFERADIGNKLRVIRADKEIVDKKVEDTKRKLQKVRSDKINVEAGAVLTVLQTAGSNPLAVNVVDTSLRSSG